MGNNSCAWWYSTIRIVAGAAGAFWCRFVSNSKVRDTLKHRNAVEQKFWSSYVVRLENCHADGRSLSDYRTLW